MKVYSNHSMTSDLYNTHMSSSTMNISGKTKVLEIVWDNIVSYSKRSLEEIMTVEKEQLDEMKSKAEQREEWYNWSIQTSDTSEETIIILTAISK